MRKRFAVIKPLLYRLSGPFLAIAIFFGYRCPAQGCPLCQITKNGQ